MSKEVLSALPIVFQVAFVIMFLLLIVQVVLVIKKIKESTVEEECVDEATVQSRMVMDAVRNGKIKKHILSDNTKKEYDSKKTLENYRKFLKTDMFQEIMDL